MSEEGERYLTQQDPDAQAATTRQDLEKAVMDFFCAMGPLANQETPETLGGVGVWFLRNVGVTYAERMAKIARTLIGRADITSKPEDKAWLLLANLVQALPATLKGLEEEDEVLLVYALHEGLQEVWNLVDESTVSSRRRREEEIRTADPCRAHPCPVPAPTQDKDAPSMDDSVVVRRVPGTDILAEHRIVMTRTLGPVVYRPLTPAELLALRRHPDCLRPADPQRLVPRWTPSQPLRVMDSES